MEWNSSSRNSKKNEMVVAVVVVAPNLHVSENATGPPVLDIVIYAWVGRGGRQGRRQGVIISYPVRNITRKTSLSRSLFV